MSKKDVKGVIPVLLTPFDTEGEPDLEATKQLVDFLAERGVHGFFPCGSYGFGPLMTTEKRKRVLEAVVEANNGRAAILAHIGAIDTKSTIDLAKHAQRVGVDAIASIPPFYHHHEDDGILVHFKEIMNAVDIPVYAYNNPEKTGHLISPELFVRLTEIGLQGMKDSTKNLSLHYKYLRLAPPRFNLLMSTEELVVPSMVMGVRGFTTGMANAFPEITIKLYEACYQKDFVKAAELQRKVHKVFDIMFMGPNIQICYECVHLRGINIGQPRLPFLPISDELRQRIKNELTDLGMLSEPYF